MKKFYKTPNIALMGKLIYKTKGADPAFTNDQGGAQNGSKPNPQQ